MASEDLFEEDFSEEIINELDQDYVGDVEEEIVDENVNQLECEKAADSCEVENEPLTTVAAADENSKTITADPKSKLFQLPLTRIRNLMKLDPDLHIASNEAVFAVARSAELFIGSLARESYSFTAQDKKKTVQKRDVDLAISAVDCLMFLEGAMNF